MEIYELSEAKALILMGIKIERGGSADPPLCSVAPAAYSICSRWPLPAVLPVRAASSWVPSCTICCRLPCRGEPRPFPWIFLMVCDEPRLGLCDSRLMIAKAIFPGHYYLPSIFKASLMRALVPTISPGTSLAALRASEREYPRD